MSRPGRAAEDTVVRRARLRIVWTTGVVVTLLVTLVGAVAYTVMTHAQDAQVRREVRYGAAYGDPERPPGCMWLYGPGGTGASDGPEGFPLRADLDRVRLTGEPVERTVRRGGAAYRVRTQLRRDGDVVQAVLDLRLQLADRDHLWLALGAAEGVGLVAAVAAGLVLGCRAVAPLAEALARQRRFVADASHELRTPLTMLRAELELGSRAGRRPEEVQRSVRSAYADTERLVRLVDSLLAQATADAPAAKTEHIQVDLAGAVSEAVDLMSRAHGEVQVGLDVDQEPLPLIGSRDRLVQLTINLIDNAVKASSPGGRVQVSVRNTGSGVLLCVRDHGPGFDPEFLPNATERFSRERPGETGDSGVGLGLAIVESIAREHAATLQITNPPGGGAQVCVEFPIQRVAPDRNRDY